MSEFELVPRGPFSLAAARSFLEAFVPLGYAPPGPREHLHLAFVIDGSDEAVGLCVRSKGGTLVGETSGGGEPDAVRAQTQRIFSLDVDGTGFPEVGRRDSVVRGLQDRYPGLRPVCFPSPYEAGVWAILSVRVRMSQAARVREALRAELGQRVEIHGEAHRAFPSPARLEEVAEFPGLFGRKLDFLRELARAARQGRLDASRLRSRPVEQALADLRSIPGIGHFAAELVLLRGAGEPDYPPRHEPRLRRAIAAAYGLDAPAADEELDRMSDRWRPYRTWVSFLLRRSAEDETTAAAPGATVSRSRPQIASVHPFA